jgi:hypothetical protein
LDAIGPDRMIAKLEREGKRLPKMLAALQKYGYDRFYDLEVDTFLAKNGRYRSIAGG